MSPKKTIVLSIVSHSQAGLVKSLLEDLCSIPEDENFDILVVLTINIPENLSFIEKQLNDVHLIKNSHPKGFGANHNQAFSIFNSDLFVVLNPDIRLQNFSFSDLAMMMPRQCGCIAPIVISPTEVVEDSARVYPTILILIMRVFFNKKYNDYFDKDKIDIDVDWVAGMFIMFNSSSFRTVSGFDENFFMYLEDANICRRLNQAGYRVIYTKSQRVIHNAQRNSFKKISHLIWHIKSMLRFLFFSPK